MSRPPAFTLTQEERNSALWQKLLGHFEARRERLRAENDNRSEEGDEHKTAARRGQISAYNDLIKLNTPRAEPEQG